MPNISGPTTAKRKIYAAVAHSTLLYGASVWEGALRIKRYAQILTSIQRKVLLRVARAYKTVSAEALQVISGVLPISLLIKERAEWERLDKEERTKRKKEELRDKYLDLWQEQWSRGERNTAVWTRTIIPDVRLWLKGKRGELEYFSTQFFTGHGSFRKYTHRIRKHEAAECPYCGNEEDSAEHTVLKCRRWEAERANLMRRLPHPGAVELINYMLESNDGWKKGSNMIT